MNAKCCVVSNHSLLPHQVFSEVLYQPYQQEFRFPLFPISEFESYMPFVCFLICSYILSALSLSIVFPHFLQYAIILVWNTFSHPYSYWSVPNKDKIYVGWVYHRFLWSWVSLHRRGTHLVRWCRYLSSPSTNIFVISEEVRRRCFLSYTTLHWLFEKKTPPLKTGNRILIYKQCINRFKETQEPQNHSSK